MAIAPCRIVLFDVDQTLLHTGGAGSYAMTLTLAEMFGLQDALAGISIAGRSDIAIMRDVLERHVLLNGDFAATLSRFKTVYLQHLTRALSEFRGYVLAGVPELLQELTAVPGVYLGLATGNFRRAALLKLDHYRVTIPLLGGGFGEDGAERERIVAAAIARVCARTGVHRDRAVVYVVGDTPGDVRAARANGAVAVAVATGQFDVESLRAAGAEIVLPDLTHAVGCKGIFENSAAL